MPLRKPGSTLPICTLLLALAVVPTTAQECLPPPPDLIGWWAGDGNAEDLVAGRDGLLLGGVVFDQGLVDGAFSFDDVDAGVEVANVGGVFDLVGSWTVDAWVYPNSPGQDARRDPVVWKIGAPGSNADTFAIGWGCRTCADRDRYQVSVERASDGQDFVVVSGAHDPAEWHHVAAVYDGTSLLVYVDGVEEGRNLIGDVTAYTGTAPLRIGNILHTSHSPRGVFDGRIDEVEIFDRALSPHEIGGIFAAGAAGKCKSADGDGDGFAPPEDCDDTDARINPGAPELPGNRFDEDCDGRLACDPCDEWRNHGRYVSCVSRAVDELVEEGSIGEELGEELVSNAARSDVGKSHTASRECATSPESTHGERVRRVGFGIEPPGIPSRHTLDEAVSRYD